MKRNQSHMLGCNSEEIATNVSTRVIAMLTDVANAQRQDLAPSRTPESAPSYGNDNCKHAQDAGEGARQPNDTKNGTANL